MTSMKINRTELTASAEPEVRILWDLLAAIGVGQILWTKARPLFSRSDNLHLSEVPLLI